MRPHLVELLLEIPQCKHMRSSGITSPVRCKCYLLTLPYHYRVAATNSIGEVYCSDQSFTAATSPTEFNYTTNYGTVTITRYTGPGGDVTIPETINGLPVTAIG